MDISNSLLNWYKKLKQVLEDSNTALVNKGLNRVGNLFQIFNEIEKLGEINRLPYLLRKDSNEPLEIIIEEIAGADKIRYYQFYDCLNLTAITIPESVTSINDYAFIGCNNLTDIHLNSTTPPTLSSDAGIPFTATIHIPIGSGDAYKSATNWSRYASRIVEDIIL